ncbi:PEP motif putative anchor domain protein [Gemmatirosa kalamazoonensis]|uniref:PEP motif putative anchor domain protein n=1 Tax=Gemmatirosa kalamazoonensis TaxID=861299 RepID=W0RBS7_9BACT|nr:PEP-CTERM sorting domain-containing protein [Gemmatirosa kalamazoonensis]AHG88559.1 PEP motif putative anchor domain protein [Gemmatirosa kalamazoonensis]
MRSPRRSRLALLCGLVVAAPPAAAQIVGVPTRSGITGTTIDWATLGPDGTVVPSGTTLGVGGVQVTMTTSGGGPMSREDQAPCGQDMLDFFPCEHLLSTNLVPLTGLAPLTFTFSQPIAAFGLNLSTHGLGAFAAFLDAYRGGTFVGSTFLSPPGFSHASSDGSAPFIGLLSLGAATDFDSLVLDQTGAPPAGWFAVNGPVFAVRAAPTAVPEPGSLTLLGIGLAALAARATAARRPAPDAAG